MDPEQKNKIKINFKTLVDNLDFDEIRDYLYSNLNSFEEEDIQKIDSEKTRAAKIRMLLRILTEKISPSDLFRVFCDSLRETKLTFYISLADQVQNADTSSLLPNDASGDDLIDTNIDASVDAKIAELQRHIMEQSKLLLQVLKIPNSDHVQKLVKEELEKIPQFKQFSNNGQFMINKNIENFSNFISDQPDSSTADNHELVLHLKKKKDAFTEIARRMGEHVFTACAGSCSSEFINYSTAMQKLLEKQTFKFKEDIKETVEGLHILEMVGYQTVDSIADELFDVCNWGRIITWFAFWKQLAEDIDNSTEQKKIFGSYIGFHIARNPLCRKWIENNGGWEWILNSGGKRWYERWIGYLSYFTAG